VGWLWNRIEVSDLLEELKPDFVFYHGMVSATIFQVVAYKRKRNPDMTIVMDNHLDYNIGYDPRRSRKDRLVCAVYRSYYRRCRRWISRVYGVTPWRETYARQVFGVEPEKTDVLVMGADDEQLDLAHREEIRSRVRGEYGIGEDEFLLINGGKLDGKKKTLELVQAVSGMSGVRLLLFGQVLPDIREELDALLAKAENVRYIGWVPAERVYDYFFAGDLAVFPGQHSVLWEQACAAKIPCIFQRWEGMEHVNACGNADFFNSADRETIRRAVEALHFTPEYMQMKRAAQSPGTDMFLYSRIAEKALECAPQR
jgi:glycosyltransferase involved in cell wall biosynthesis